MEKPKPTEVPPAPPKDTEAPRLTGFQQRGLSEFTFDFSEPIKSSELHGQTPLFGQEKWSVDRRSLTVPFDTTFIQPFRANSLFLTSVTDDAGNTQTLDLEVPIDVYAPEIVSARWVDEHRLEVLFDEDVVLTDDSRLTLNSRVSAKPEALRSTDEKLTFQVDGEALPQTTSYLLKLNGAKDVYGNKADVTTGRYVFSADKIAPTILSIEQKPTEKNGPLSTYVFHLSYSEYVVDSRDAEPDSGIFGNLGGLIDSLRSFELNGKETFFFLTIWEPDQDHKGATIKFRYASDLNHGAVNSISLDLVDIAGNAGKASFEFTPDLRAPQLSGRTACLMEGTIAFRCKISEADVKEAILGPESEWPRDSYRIQVTEEKTDDKTQAWLNVMFKEDRIHEGLVQSIQLFDSFGNTNVASGNDSVFFEVVTKAPSVTKVNAFGRRVLELEMDRPVEAISSIDIGSSSDVPFVLKTMNVPVVIEFAEDLPEGDYTVKLKGVKSRFNPAAIGDVTIGPISNRESAILRSTVRAVRSTNVLNLELSGELTGELKVFSRSRVPGQVPLDTLLTDITVLKDPMTARGTLPLRLVKPTAAGLEPNSATQLLVIQLGNEASRREFVVAWSTQAPEFRVDFASTDKLLLASVSARLVETSSLDLEIVDAEGRSTPVAVEPLTPNAPARTWYVPLPKEPPLQPGTYQLRIKNARTQAFGIPLAAPQSLSFTVK